MKKYRLNAVLMLLVTIFGGYIAYTGAQPIVVAANPPPIINITPPKKPVISINLNTNKIECKDVENASVNIQKTEKPKPVIKWKTKLVEKTVVLDNQPAPYRIIPLVRDKSVILTDDTSKLLLTID